MPNLPQRSESELELLVTPIRAGAGRAARGETIKLRVPSALFNRADAIWRLGRALQALIDRPAKR
jgi:hypothetical protein